MQGALQRQLEREGGGMRVLAVSQRSLLPRELRRQQQPRAGLASVVQSAGAKG